MSSHTNDPREFFGSISFYHTASENLLEGHFSENEAMRINRESFTNCRSSVGPSKCFVLTSCLCLACFQGPQMPRTTRQPPTRDEPLRRSAWEADDSLAHYALHPQTTLRCILSYVALPAGIYPLTKRKIEPDLRETNSRHLGLEGRPQRTARNLLQENWLIQIVF